ncbi:MAG: hypothetical protein ACI4DN_06555 [Lachnospiraceae bacterium]
MANWNGKILIFLTMQEPINEVFGTRLHQRLGCKNYVSYNMLLEDGIPYSVCENFIDTNSELVNTDRHFGNFGAIRNVETLEWIGPAPVFDSGTSLWHDKLTRAINPLGEIETKPFYSNASRQMELVSDFSWIPFEELRNLNDDIKEIFVPTEFIDEERIEALSKAVSSRVEKLQEMELEQKKQFTLGSLQ